MSSSAVYEVAEKGGTRRLTVSGLWIAAQAIAADAGLRSLAEAWRAQRGGEVVIDLTGVERLDTTGAWMLQRTAAAVREGGGAARFEGASEAQRILLEEVARNIQEMAAVPPKPNIFIQIADRSGRALVAVWDECVLLLGFLGQIVAVIGRVALRPRRLRSTSLVHHMEQTGFNAIPIVSLLTFLIGAVLAQQGAFQLKRFGAEVFTVNLIGITVLREIGLLLTAIIIAGRSGSAFTAEIGSMKIREEIDAMRTLGLDPMEILVLPRVLALILVLPLLTFIADIMGLIGGGMLSMVSLGLSPVAYIERLNASVGMWTFWVGIIKAPFMALLIGMIGCLEGMKVSGSAESVGIRTTSSVVKSIFAVIVVDALFAIFFAEVGV